MNVPVQPTPNEFDRACQHLLGASFEVRAHVDHAGRYDILSHGQTKPYYPDQMPNQVMNVARMHGYQG